MLPAVRAILVPLGLVLALVVVLGPVLRQPRVAEPPGGQPRTPVDVYDPVAAGEPTPPGFRQLLGRDGIRPIYEPVHIAADEVDWDDDTLGDSLAVPVEAMRAGVVNAEVGGVPVAFVAEPAAGGWWAVYSRRLDDRVVVLALRDGVLADGPGRWDPVRGLPLDGGQRLDPLGALTIFPRDFPVHFPQGRVWSP